MFAGGDRKTISDGSRVNAYSSYMEFGYPFTVKGVQLNAAVEQYKNDDFAVTNVSLKATKEIHFNERFSLPVYTQVIWNPNREDVHFVFGITIR